MIPYLARLLGITMNNNAIPGVWEKDLVFFHSLRGISIGSWKIYRPVSLNSVVCKLMEQVISGYLKQILEMSRWLY